MNRVVDGMPVTAASVAERMTRGRQWGAESLVLVLEGFAIRLRSNDGALLQRLRRYFAPVVGDGNLPADVTVLIVEAPATDLDLSFADWTREPGKTGRKDAYVDLPDGRVIRKVRTGMVFLQSSEHRIARGPCTACESQVINFIVSQYMNHLQQRGALICHASGLVLDGRCLAIAGLSGGGKSTLNLMLMEDPESRFLTNDRLFLSTGPSGITARGIPKLPRINPGTILGNPRLHPMLPPERRAALEAMPAGALWALEEKHDVDIAALYGADRIALSAPLSAFLVLNWRRDSGAPCRIDTVDLASRPDLLGAIMKSPGPFFQSLAGDFIADDADLTPGPYLAMLRDRPIYEASGSIDFDAAMEFCLSLLREGDG